MSPSSNRETPCLGGRSVAVLGGGIVGLCTAYHLVRLGARVTVVDRSFEAHGASWGNAGSISPGSVLPVAYKGMIRDVPRMLLDPTGPLRVTASGLGSHAAWLASFLRHATPAQIRRSADGIAALVREAMTRHVALLDAIDSRDLLRATGQLHLYPDRAAVERDRFGWTLRREFGVAVEEIGREEILALEPAVGPAYTAGVFLPEQGMIVDPGEYSGRLRAVLRQSGVRLVEDDVRDLDLARDGAPALVGEAERHGADDVVLCGGSWSADLVRRFGCRIPLANQRGFHVQFPDSGVSLERVVVLADRKVFVTPMSNGLRAAGTVEVTRIDSAADMRRADALVGHVQTAWPQLKAAPRSTWSGERPCLPDSLPVMGRSPVHPRLWFNFGHGHLGLTLSAVAGEEIARALAEGVTSPMLRALGPERFA